MFQANTDIAHALGEFQLEDCMFRYNEFIPKLYNYCKSLDFEMDKIMPSRAFCSDGSQGYPIILITKHFGIFPFNHGRVGGVMATQRHGPHAAHGKDMLIIQASHVGYDPDTQEFGGYRRICTEHKNMSFCCGKLASIIRWYQDEYEFAKNNIFLQKINNDNFIIVDNHLIDKDIEQGLFLNLSSLVENDNGKFTPYKSYSTSKCFKAAPAMAKSFEGLEDKKPIGDELLPEFFYYKKELDPENENLNHLEHNILPVMPWIVSSKSPLLTAAKVNVQVEFDRTFRTIVKERGYRRKRLIYITGLNIDISPREDQVFPITMFVPWAMFVQSAEGEQRIIEQAQIVEILHEMSADNPEQIDVDDSIRMMEDEASVSVGIS